MSSHWEDGTNDADTSFKAITAYDGRQPRQPPDSGQRRDGKSWSDLSSYTMQISVDGFSRMSAAGVDGLTLSVGQGLLGVFKLSELGERRVQTAVEKLTKRRAFHKGLVFGFGSRHLVRSVTKTAEGLSCVALCASMGEFYGRDTCASILRELLNLAFHPPPHLSPSLRQWALMIEAFQGTLAVSDFGALCGKMYQAYRSCGMDERVSISRPQRGLLMPPAGSTKQIAQALVGLMKLTEGTMRAMTLTGGPDCVWFAVVAEWLFGLNVLMKNDRTGQVLYESRTELHGSITILFGVGARGQVSSEDLNLRVRSNEYAITDGYQLFNGTHSPARLLSTGRTSWERIWSDTYGNRASEFLFGDEYPGLAGRAFAYGARVLRSCVSGESMRLGIPTSDPITLSSKSYGKGLLNTLRYWFPEIKHSSSFVDGAEQVFGQTIPMDQCGLASDQWYQWYAIRKELFKEIATICGCSHCVGDYEFGSDPPIWPVDIICYIGLLRALWLIGVVLSCAVVEGKNIMPSGVGFERFYIDAYEMIDPDLVGRLHWPRDFTTRIRRRGGTKFGERYVMEFSVVQYLSCLFSGPSHERSIRALGGYTNRLEQGVVAISTEGFVYMHELLLSPSDDIDLISQIHVIPGGIEFNGNRYTRLYGQKEGGFDESQKSRPRNPDPSCPPVEVSDERMREYGILIGGDRRPVSQLPTESIENFSRSSTPPINCTLIIEERLDLPDALEVFYEISIGLSKIQTSISYLQQKIMKSSTGRDCPKLCKNGGSIPITHYWYTRGNGFAQDPGCLIEPKNCVIVRNNHDVAGRWLLLLQDRIQLREPIGSPNRETLARHIYLHHILQNRTCFNCCLQEAAELALIFQKNLQATASTLAKPGSTTQAVEYSEPYTSATPSNYGDNGLASQTCTGPGGNSGGGGGLSGSFIEGECDQHRRFDCLANTCLPLIILNPSRF